MKILKNRAFTLAEVLITLGIIGVVAAMTIPTLISKIGKRQLEAQIKTSYATIVQTMRSSEADDNAFDMLISDFDDNNMKEWFKNYISPYMKIEKVCYNTFGCWHKKGEVKDLNKNKAWYSDNPGMGLNTLSFVTAKGIYFSIDGWGTLNTLNSIFGITSNQDSLIFYFDANGDKKPNRVGKDIYVMVYVPDKGLIPAGSDKTVKEVEQNCLNGNGYWCLSYIKSNGWQISDKVWKR